MADNDSNINTKVIGILNIIIVVINAIITFLKSGAV